MRYGNVGGVVERSAVTKPVDFFVSHAGPDQDWASWIAQQLLTAGYTVELDVWHWAAGMDVIQLTRRAMERASRLLSVWTPVYFERIWAQMELQVAFRKAQVKPGFVVPVLVRGRDADIPDLYAALKRIELIGATEPEARRLLLDGVAGPKPPTERQPFPGTALRGGYPGRLPPVWNVPIRNPFFTGRDGALAELHRQLSGPGQATALLVGEHGEGGFGKTALAIEYAWRYAGEYDLVWWVEAGRPDGVEASLADLAAVLGVRAAGDTVLAALFAALGQRTNWLLVFDDVAGGDQLAMVRPPPSGRVLITSRDNSLGPVSNRLALGRFDRAESVELLHRRCRWLAPPVAGRIAAVVGDLPLAVAQAGAFLAQSGLTAEEYLPRLRERAARVGDDSVGLAATVAVGLDRLGELDLAAAELLEELALLGPEPVPLAIPGPEQVPGLVVGDPDTTSEVVTSIVGLGLASRAGTQLQLHSRVREVIGRSLTDKRRAVVLGRALRLLVAADPGDPGDPATWTRYAALSPHVQAVMAVLAGTPGVTETVESDRLLAHVCRYLRLTGRHDASHDLAALAYQRRRSSAPDEDPEALRWATQLADSLRLLGRHAEARELLAETFDRQLTLAGPDHPDTLCSAHGLGVCVAEMAELERAQELLQGTLDRRRRVLGQDAPDTLQSATAVGAVLHLRGYHEQARNALDDALDRRRRALGPDHPDTLATTYHLGLALAGLGDHQSASNVLGEVVRLRRRVLGTSHPETLSAAYRLGLALDAAGDHQAAALELGHALDGRRALLGPDHADTLAAAHALGLALSAAGRGQDAAGILGAAADGRQRALGPEAPDTLASRHHLGIALAAIGEYQAAADVLADACERRRRVLGIGHPDTLQTELALRALPPPSSPI